MTDIDLGEINPDAVPTTGDPSTRLKPEVSGRSTPERPRTLAAIAPDRFRDPLRAAFADRQVELTAWERVRTGSGDDPYGVRAVAEDQRAADGLLLIVPEDQPLATAVPGPVVEDVPVGVLPAEDPAVVRSWLEAIGGGVGPVPAWSVLAMGRDRYLEPAGDLRVRLSSATIPEGVTVRDWRANRIDRRTLCASLAVGPSLCVYLGHGTGDGWGGYQNCTWCHVAAVEQARPIGSIVSLSCDTLHDRGDEQSFGLRLIRSGRVRTFVGSPAEISVNGIQAVADTIADVVLTKSPATVGELLAAVQASVDGAGQRTVDRLRIVGLPVEPLC